MQEVVPMGDEGELRSMQDRLTDTMILRQQETIDGLEIAGRAVVAGLEIARREVVDYLSQRIRVELDTRQALLRCRSFDEVRELRSRYLRDAIEQFGEEAKRLMRLGAVLAARSIDRARI